MHRHAAHRDRRAGLLAAGGERDIERTRRRLRIGEEQLVEIPHAQEQQRVRMLRLEREPLRHDGRGTVGRRQACRRRGGGHGGKTGAARGQPPATSSRSALHIFSSAYIVRASGLNRCTTMSPASISTQSDPPAPFHLHALQPGGVQLFHQMLGHRRDLAVGKPACDHHPVAERGAAGEVEGDDLFRLVVFQAGDDHLLQPLEPPPPAPARRGGQHDGRARP